MVSAPSAARFAPATELTVIPAASRWRVSKAFAAIAATLTGFALLAPFATFLVGRRLKPGAKPDRKRRGG